MEIVSNGAVVSATRFNWARNGGDYVLQSVVTERYDGDAVVSRATFATADASAPTAGTWQAASKGPLVSAIRSKHSSKSGFAHPGTQDLCDHHDCPLLKGSKKKAHSSMELAGNVSGRVPTDSLFRIEDCATKPCYALLVAMIAAGASATAAFAAAGAGAIGTFLTGGALAPAEVAAVMAYFSAEAAFIAAEAAYIDCRGG
jgi:hypothetical protein